MLSALLLLLSLPALLVSGETYPVQDGGGVLITPATWDASGSPYILLGPVSFYGALTIKSGAVILGQGNSILVYGTLRADGTSSNLITFSDTTIIPGSGLVVITYANFSGGSPFARLANGGNPAGAVLQLRNSLLTKLDAPITLANPIYSTYAVSIDSNTFIDCPGISIATPTKYRAVIQNNIFYRQINGASSKYPENKVAIVVKTTASSMISITKNWFASPSLIAIELGIVGAAGVYAPNNYFGPNADFDTMLWDSRDDSNLTTIIFEPFMTKFDSLNIASSSCKTLICQANLNLCPGPITTTAVFPTRTTQATPTPTPTPVVIDPLCNICGFTRGTECRNVVPIFLPPPPAPAPVETATPVPEPLPTTPEPIEAGAQAGIVLGAITVVAAFGIGLWTCDKYRNNSRLRHWAECKSEDARDWCSQKREVFDAKTGKLVQKTKTVDIKSINVDCQEVPVIVKSAPYGGNQSAFDASVMPRSRVSSSTDDVIIIDGRPGTMSIAEDKTYGFTTPLPTNPAFYPVVVDASVLLETYVGSGMRGDMPIYPIPSVAGAVHQGTKLYGEVEVTPATTGGNGLYPRI